MLVGLLDKLRLDDRVTRVFPNFGVHGKIHVTVRSLLAHCSGLAGWRPFHKDIVGIEKQGRLSFVSSKGAKDYVYERQMWPRQEAIDFFTKRGEPLKVQLIEEKTAGQPEVSVYTIKDKDTFLDFCVGPHVPSVGKLGHFKLTSTSSAYWKGDAKNQPMQRVYGTAFFSKKDLEDHLHRLRRGALEIRVLDAQDELAAVMPGEEPIEESGARAADVQIAGRAGREAGANGHRGT